MPGDESMVEAEMLCAELETAGLDVLFDDREVRPGVKFADADLIGMPVQIIVGEKGIAKGIVERKHRATGERDEIPRVDAVATLVDRSGRCRVTLKVKPPVSPMLAKLAREMPVGDQWAYEPKWDGFRCIVFRDGKEIELGSRNERPLTRYFPDLIEPLRAALPDGAVVDGEIVIKTDDGPGLRPAVVADPPGREPRRDARRGDTGRVRRLRPARRGQARPAGAAVRGAAGQARGDARRGRLADPPHPDHA